MQFNDTIEKSKTQLLAVNAKAMEYAEENAKAAFAFTREALVAKTPESLFAIQQAYFRSQQEAAIRQAEALSKLYADWLKETTAPITDALRSFMPRAA